ncbi:MAG TPA: hypothetical protein VHO66_03255 [Ruminiclostridium sp.]|nr:hypothetical protein [Ruminiclostridium sp.]
MKIKRYGFKLVTVAVVAVTMAVLLINFDSIFTELSCDALTITQTKSDKAELPSSLNYIDEDKSVFVNYCKDIYGDDLPLKIDENVYQFYGTINGLRFYRLQSTLIPYDNINQSELIGGYSFDSPGRFRPYSTGLYIIGDDKVYTLKQAYESGLINIQKAFDLYNNKQ